MATDFPNSPNVNDVFNVGNRSWRWTDTVFSRRYVYKLLQGNFVVRAEVTR
jgi:hypothetical protein